MTDLGNEDPAPPAPRPQDGTAPRRERRDVIRHRARILTAASALFAEHGVAATTMHDIARAAGVGQGTLYRRYAHKGDLCRALLDVAFREFQATVAAIHANNALAALEQLSSVLAALVDFNEAQGGLLQGIEDSARGLRWSDRYQTPIYTWLRQVLIRLLEQAQQRSEIPPLHTGVAADTILAGLSIDLYRYQRIEQGYTPERILAGVRQLIFGGLRGDAPR